MSARERLIAWLWPMLRPMIVDLIRIMIEDARREQAAAAQTAPMKRRYIGVPGEPPQ